MGSALKSPHSSGGICLHKFGHLSHLNLPNMALLIAPIQVSAEEIHRATGAVYLCVKRVAGFPGFSVARKRNLFGFSNRPARQDGIPKTRAVHGHTIGMKVMVAQFFG